MIGHVLQFADLQQLCRPKANKPPRRATVEAWARSINLAYKPDGSGGILTTLEALNVALGVAAANDAATISPDELF